MKKLHVFKVMKRITKNREHILANNLAKELNTLEHYKMQLSKVQQYQQEYKKKLHNISESNVSVLNLKLHHNFLQHIINIEIGQKKKVSEQYAKVEYCKLQWNKMRTRERMLEQYISNVIRDLELEQELAEQKIVDEFVNISYAVARTNDPV